MLNGALLKCSLAILETIPIFKHSRDNSHSSRKTLWMEELLERNFHAVMLPEDLSMAFAHTQSMIAGDLQTFLHELRFVCKDGSQIWVNPTVTLSQFRGVVKARIYSDRGEDTDDAKSSQDLYVEFKREAVRLT
jgi:hypothetical protein